jgi:cysteine desulfurase
MKRIYLDYAATTPTHEKVVEAMKPYFSEKFGNPSSIHFFGQEAKAAVEAARDKVASLIGANRDEIFFTSGGTEADNWAIVGVAFGNESKGKHIITSPIEHHAVSEPAEFLKARGWDVTYLPVDKFGLVDPADVKKAITDKTVLVSVMHANNEIGTIEPIAEISKVVKEKGVLFHTDAVQTTGAIEVNVSKLGADLMSASAHKLYGPKGVGTLYIKKGTKIEKFLRGGGQEKGKRATTENVPAIVGFGVAAELAMTEMNDRKKHLIPLRDKLIDGILNSIEDSILNGHPKQRLPNNTNFCIKFVEGESMLLNLDMLGIAASSGSACTSGSLEPSHVLLSIGLPHEFAHGSLRFTLGRLTAESDIDHVLQSLPGIVKKLRDMSPLYKKK